MTGTAKIPFFGVDRQYNDLREEILDATDLVYDSGQVLDGPRTKIFEQTIKPDYQIMRRVNKNIDDDYPLFVIEVKRFENAEGERT